LQQVGRLSELSEATPLALAEQGETQQHISEARQSPVQAIALTAYAREEDRQQAIKAGFQMHIPKPVEPDVLVAVVAKLAERTLGRVIK
jgi:CheY-like chemotaxis protein